MFCLCLLLSPPPQLSNDSKLVCPSPHVPVENPVDETTWPSMDTSVSLPALDKRLFDPMSLANRMLATIVAISKQPSNPPSKRQTSSADSALHTEKQNEKPRQGFDQECIAGTATITFTSPNATTGIIQGAILRLSFNVQKRALLASAADCQTTSFQKPWACQRRSPIPGLLSR